jgi:glycosyltransferase involved in cell wall biosynthesis
VIRALQSEGVDVEPFTTSHAISETARADPDPPCQWRLVRTPRLSKAVAASAAAGVDGALVRAARAAARGADAIYQRHGRFSLAGALLSRLTGTPLILEYNGSEVFVERNWMTSRTPLSGRIESCENAALAAAAKVVVVSDVDRRSLVARGVDPGRIVVNPNGVDASRFARGGGAEVRSRYEIGPDATVIGFVGSFGPWHGAPVLARAFVQVADRRPDARLLLVGEGLELPETLKILREAGIEERVTAIGSVPPHEIPGLLDACDILVAPHVPLAGGVEFFGSPTKLYEYMAAGKAIAASRLGQIGEVLEHGATAMLSEPGDAVGLLGALLDLTESPDLRSKLGANARRQAVERHSWRLNARRIIDVFANDEGDR